MSNRLKGISAETRFPLSGITTTFWWPITNRSELRTFVLEAVEHFGSKAAEQFNDRFALVLQGGEEQTEQENVSYVFATNEASHANGKVTTIRVPYTADKESYSNAVSLLHKILQHTGTFDPSLTLETVNNALDGVETQQEIPTNWSIANHEGPSQMKPTDKERKTSKAVLPPKPSVLACVNFVNETTINSLLKFALKHAGECMSEREQQYIEECCGGSTVFTKSNFCDLLEKGDNERVRCAWAHMLNSLETLANAAKTTVGDLLKMKFVLSPISASVFAAFYCYQDPAVVKAYIESMITRENGMTNLVGLTLENQDICFYLTNAGKNGDDEMITCCKSSVCIGGEQIPMKVALQCCIENPKRFLPVLKKLVGSAKCRSP